MRNLEDEALRATDPGAVNDGGPAFPMHSTKTLSSPDGYTCEVPISTGGISTRTLLTAAALASCRVDFAHGGGGEADLEHHAGQVAHFAVRVADAAIKKLGL